MGVCILYSEAYLRKRPKADEKLIETQIAATLKQALLQKAIKIKCMRTKKSNSFKRYAITCNVIAYHLVNFFSIWVIHKCKSGIDFFTSVRAVKLQFYG